MIQTATEIVLGFAFVAKRRGWPIDVDVELLEGALREAGDLARASEHDEPAAVFFALAKRPAIFGAGWRFMASVTATGQARKLGLRMVPPPGALDSFCTKSAAGEATFGDVQRWFAEQMKPAD